MYLINKTIAKIAFIASLAVLLFSSCRKDTASKGSTAGSSTDPSQYVVGAHGELIPKNNFHVIENGYKLTVQNQHVYKVEIASGKFVKDFGEFKHLYTFQKNNMSPVVSNSASAPNDTTRSLATLRNNKNVTFGTSAGWVAAEEWHNTAASPINYFSTTCVVPPMPTTQINQTFAFWIGLSPLSDGDQSIVQPILNYGQPPQSTAANTYQVFNYFFWVGANGYNAAMTTPVTVTPGTTIKFVISYTGTTSGSYDYTSNILNSSGTPITPAMSITIGNQYLNGSGSSGNATVPAVSESNYADIVLEDREIPPYMTSRSEYPNTSSILSYVAMSNISLSTGNPGQYSYPASLSWYPLPTPGGPQLGETEQVISAFNNNTTNPGQINLWYAAPPPFGVYYTNSKTPPFGITLTNTTNPSQTYTSVLLPEGNYVGDFAPSPMLPSGNYNVIIGQGTTYTGSTTYTVGTAGGTTSTYPIRVNNVYLSINSGNYIAPQITIK